MRVSERHIVITAVRLDIRNSDNIIVLLNIQSRARRCHLNIYDSSVNQHFNDNSLLNREGNQYLLLLNNISQLNV